MELRDLGATGLLISPVGLGTVKLGRNEAVKYRRPFELPSDERARELLDVAADLGINLIDTAPAYGSSEERLGSLLAGSRERWIISTKVGEEFEGGASRFDFSPGHVRASVERSLRRLRTDRLDVVLVHSDGNEAASGSRAALGALDVLADLKREGLTRAVGFSAKTLEGARAAMGLSDVLMLTLNPREREMLPVIRECAAAGVGVLVKKALISGGVGAPGESVRDCLGLAFGEPGVSSVVLGTLNPEHLRESVEIARRA